MTEGQASLPTIWEVTLMPPLDLFLLNCQYPQFPGPWGVHSKEFSDNKVHCRWFLCFRGNRDLQVTPGSFSSRRSREGLDDGHRSLPLPASGT